jgi:hypothetical protein
MTSALSRPTPLLIAFSLALAPLARADEPVPADSAADQFPELGTGAKLRFLVEHPFARSVAKERVGQLLSYWGSRFGINNRWKGDHVQLDGRILGIDFKARLEVQDHCVGGEATDPGLLLRQRAHDYIRRKLLKYLSPTYQEP